jgi:Ca2+-binding RTX toxin-like protein
MVDNAGAATQAAGAGADTIAAGAATQAAGAGADTVAAGAGVDTQAGGAARTSMQRAGDGVPDPVAPADFPADWREKIAGSDTKALERLKRMPAPTDLWKSYTELDKRLNSGASDAPMPDPVKDAEGAKKWREERGIPEDPTGYKLPDAVTKVLTDADKPVLADFTGFAHKRGASPAAVAVAAEWYTDFAARQLGEQVKADKSSSSECDDVLRQEYGTDFKPMMTIAGRYANELFGVEGADILTMARFPTTPDTPEALRGKRIGDVPEVMKGFVAAALDKYGDVSFVGGEATKKTTDRITEIEGIMKTKFDVYDGDPAMQAEYLQLLQARDKKNAAKAG